MPVLGLCRSATRRDSQTVPEVSNGLQQHLAGEPSGRSVAVEDFRTGGFHLGFEEGQTGQDLGALRWVTVAGKVQPSDLGVLVDRTAGA